MRTFTRLTLSFALFAFGGCATTGQPRPASAKEESLDLPLLPGPSDGPPVEGISPNVRYKYSRLTNDWHVGDCLLRAGAEVRFYEDGKTTFSGTVRSEDSGDVWRQDHIVLNQYDAHLFDGKRWTRVLEPKSRDLYFQEPPAGYPQTHFEAIAKVRWKASC